jgi:hypothetical protein
MKKLPNKKDPDENFRKIQRRNQFIMIVSLLLAIFFAIFYPMLFGNG